MTGIERLRELIKDYRSGHECEGIECGELSCGECIAKNVLEPIATQIEREHAEDCYRMVLDYGTVSRVASEMERHVLGHEGMEDSPVARWARELRAALGGHVEEVADVATIRKDAYDAYEWVEANGGLDELRKRLVPEGMDGMISRYPRYEDGTPALPGMEAVANSGERSGEDFVIKKAWVENGTWHLSDSVKDGHYWHWKHGDHVVKRPAPKDSWERLEEDATIDPRAYCSKHRLYIDPYDGDSAPATEKFARDLVRRARALAERGQ